MAGPEPAIDVSVRFSRSDVSFYSKYINAFLVATVKKCTLTAAEMAYKLYGQKYREKWGNKS